VDTKESLVILQERKTSSRREPNPDSSVVQPVVHSLLKADQFRLIVDLTTVKNVQTIGRNVTSPGQAPEMKEQ